MRLIDGFIAEYADVQGADQVVDCRPKAAYDKAHVAGAIHLPVSEMLNLGALKDKASLSAAFAQSGVDLQKPTIFMCGMGIASCVGIVAAQGLIEEARFYDGSYTDYARQQSE